MVAVILNHVLRWPSGGFVGVDVFFVISGFLITGQIFREKEKTGEFSLSAFYARRVRRIVPSAAAVLLVTVVVGYFLFNSTRALATMWDAVLAFVFAANWRFAALGTDYFHAVDPASPLQHYWSLSVEEQFYLVWPWLLLLIFAIAANEARKARVGRIIVAVVMAVIIAASFGYSLWQTARDPQFAYFSTFSHVWELGLGVLLAAASPLLVSIPTGVRALMGWVGLLGVGASLFILNDAIAFPSPGAAMPVVAAALVIAAGIGGPQRYLFPLVNPVSVYLGNISYSLYLWHFPVLVFLLLLMPEQSVSSTLIILGAILALSVVSYYLVEQPFHRSPWLRAFGEPGERTAAWTAWRERFGTQFIVSTVGIIAIATIAVFGVGTALQGSRPALAPEAAATQPAQNPEAQLQADLSAAVSATSWPGNLSPSLDSVMSTTSNNNPARDCFNTGNTPDFGRCTWGNSNAPHHMYVVGDSEALSYAPAFKAIAEASGGQWKITTIGLYGCRFTDVLVQNDGNGVMDSCPQRKQDIANKIAGDHPQLVVIANAYALGQTPDGTPISAAAMVQSTVTEAAKYNSAGKILYLSPPPLGAELGQCYNKVSSPQNCNTAVDAAWNEFARDTIAAKGPGDTFINSLPYSCFSGVCPAFAGTLPTKYDSVHMTVNYSEHIAPALRYDLVALGLM